jgi:hypothetical protein
MVYYCLPYVLFVKTPYLFENNGESIFIGT